MERKEFCFTIMPFEGYFNDYYIKIYKVAIEESNLQSLRSDDLFTPGTIVNDIWDHIQNSRIVLADLTQQNANVFYELGLAHASGKPVILLSESIDDIPFDLRALRIILYDKNLPDWGYILKNNIKQAIAETLSSPLKAILPTFLSITKDKNSFVSESDKILLEIKSDLEFLKRSQEVARNPYYDLKGNNYSLNLSAQEIDILKMISKGLSQGEIAQNLNLRISTVEKSIVRLKSNFKAKNTMHLIKIATDLGLI